MDIQHLVDRLEDLIDEGRHVPMSRYTVVDEERALEIIDQMRISIPEQVEKATRLVNQRDRLIAQANEEASRMIDIARQKNDDLVNRDAIVQTAKLRADNILRQAELEAERIRDEADGYVVDVLKELESQLLRTLTIVRNGITKIIQDREIRAQHMAQLQQEVQTQLATIQQQATQSPPVEETKVESSIETAKEALVEVKEDELVDAE